MIRLYGMGESGNAYKAALALELSGLEWEPVFVDFFKGECRSPEFLAINPMGEVPVMIDDEHDYILTQSGAIQDYITHLSGKFAGNSPEERREVLRWVLWDNHKMSSQAGVLRFLMNFLPEEKRNADVIAWVRGRFQAALKTLDAALEGKDWLVGDGPTNADLSNCGYLFYPEEFAFNRKAHANIDRWLTNIEGLDGWKYPYDLMERAYHD